FASRALGVAAANRRIILGVTDHGIASPSSPTATVGGVSATRLVTATGDSCNTHLFVAKVKDGTTGDVVVSYPTAPARCGVGLWAAYGIGDTPLDTFAGNSVAGSSTTYTDAIDVVRGGIGVAYGTARLDPNSP